MNQSNSPAFYQQSINSNNPPSIIQPQSVNSLQQPQSVNSLQQPQSVSSLQQPHSVSNLQQPHSVNSLQQPHSVNSLQPTQISSGSSHSIHFSAASTNINQSELNSHIQSFQYEFGQEEIPEPISKSKELFNQLKISIQNLFTQLTIILNPSNENNKQSNENQFQLLGKYIENFNKTCDLLTVNLRAACETQLLSNELKQYYRYYAHMDHMDAARNEGQMLNSVNIQMQRINELKNVLQRFLSTNQMKQ